MPRPSTTRALETPPLDSTPRQFRCQGCGGPMVFLPGTLHLKCAYCGNETEIPVDAGNSRYLQEQDFLASLKDERETEGAPLVLASVHCASCGAETTVSPERTSENCPYCGSPLSMQNRYTCKLRVQALLPFEVPADQALERYRVWLATRWFAPSGLKRRAALDGALAGLYMPYWTFDAETKTAYTGQRGDAYYTTETRTVTRNGQTYTETYQVRHISWSYASGSVWVPFDDVLVPASHSLPRALREKLGPWPLDQLKPFQQEFLSGFVTEAYQIGLEDGFEDAKVRMEPTIDRAIRRDIGGDEQQVSTTRSSYSQVTFKHILLPVWLSAYSYGGATFRFVINAQTGEVTGERPWSAWKIAAAITAGLAAIWALVTLYSNR